ncbi:head-tail connector protein [Pantoea phage Kyle]|uniref:Head-tail connector protein n=1 Tax=Pantoea phage Kyle TaxID=2589665 RepID=A0A514A8J0_9CAUD|nr:head protein [Pantoea phage Kyle]QDH49586.1 head-tail connector protein [Pantoea phage Kyle]
MIVPGANLFRLATRLIKPQPIEYYRFAGRDTDRQRNLVDTYFPVQTIMASVQAVPRDSYAELGLDFQKNYLKIYVAMDVMDLERDASGDMFAFGARKRFYKLTSETPWFDMDGWCSAIAVQVLQSFPITFVSEVNGS